MHTTLAHPTPLTQIPPQPRPTPDSKANPRHPERARLALLLRERRSDHATWRRPAVSTN